MEGGGTGCSSASAGRRGSGSQAALRRQRQHQQQKHVGLLKRFEIPPECSGSRRRRWGPQGRWGGWRTRWGRPAARWRARTRRRCQRRGSRGGRRARWSSAGAGECSCGAAGEGRDVQGSERRLQGAGVHGQPSHTAGALRRLWAVEPCGGQARRRTAQAGLHASSRSHAATTQHRAHRWHWPATQPSWWRHSLRQRPQLRLEVWKKAGARHCMWAEGSGVGGGGDRSAESGFTARSQARRRS